MPIEFGVSLNILQKIVVIIAAITKLLDITIINNEKVEPWWSVCRPKTRTNLRNSIADVYLPLQNYHSKRRCLCYNIGRAVKLSWLASYQEIASHNESIRLTSKQTKQKFMFTKHVPSKELFATLQTNQGIRSMALFPSIMSQFKQWFHAISLQTNTLKMQCKYLTIRQRVYFHAFQCSKFSDAIVSSKSDWANEQFVATLYCAVHYNLTSKSWVCTLILIRSQMLSSIASSMLFLQS